MSQDTKMLIFILVLAVGNIIGIEKALRSQKEQVTTLTAKLKEVTDRADQYEYNFHLCVFLLNRE